MPGLCSDAELQRNDWPWIGESAATTSSRWTRPQCGRLHGVDITAGVRPRVAIARARRGLAGRELVA